MCIYIYRERDIDRYKLPLESNHNSKNGSDWTKFPYRKHVHNNKTVEIQRRGLRPVVLGGPMLREIHKRLSFYKTAVKLVFLLCWK